MFVEYLAHGKRFLLDHLFTHKSLVISGVNHPGNTKIHDTLLASLAGTTHAQNPVLAGFTGPLDAQHIKSALGKVLRHTPLEKVVDGMGFCMPKQAVIVFPKFMLKRMGSQTVVAKTDNVSSNGHSSS